MNRAPNAFPAPLALLLALIAIPVLAIGCGGGGDEGEDAIRESAQRILDAETVADAKAVCAENLTARYIDDVYGGNDELCGKNPVNDDSEIENPGEPTVGEITIDGDEAEVALTTEGGVGPEGTWTMAEEEGDWKLDRLEDDFVRDSFMVAVENVKGGILTFGPMRRCITPQVEKLPDEKIRELTYQSAREQKNRVLNTMNGLAEKCPRQLAEYVADTLAKQVLPGRGLSAAEIRCAKREMVPLLQVSGLAPNALNGNNEFGGATAYALTGVISGAMKNCQKG